MTAPLLLIYLLADRRGVPSALLFCPGRDEAEAAANPWMLGALLAGGAHV